MRNPVTIAGWDTYPEAVDYVPFLVGGAPRDSMNGTFYRKITAQKHKVPLVWGYLSADEMQVIRVVWSICQQGPVTIACADPAITGTFLVTDVDFPFTLIEGQTAAYKGALNFVEQ